jgi:hypothetical protein
MPVPGGHRGTCIMVFCSLLIGSLSLSLVCVGPVVLSLIVIGPARRWRLQASKHVETVAGDPKTAAVLVLASGGATL